MKVLKFVTLFFVSLTTVLFLACAGSKDKSVQIDENAFQQQEQSTAKESANEPTPDEAEVLKLLGIKSESEKAKPATEAGSPQVAQESVGELESKVAQLETQIKEKDKALKTLKAELDERESRIATLRSQLSQKSTAPSSPSTAVSPGSTSFKERYQQALSLYNNRQYEAAIKIFDELLAMNVNNSLVDNCQYWKGESYYGLGNYHQALVEFEKVFTFSNSNKYPDAQLKIGLCYLRLGDIERAKTELEKVITDYPDSEYVGRAQSYLERLQ